MVKDRKKISFKDQTIWAGLDVHLLSWTVAICSEHRVYRPFKMSPPKVEDLVYYLRKKFPEATYICAYESGFSGYGLCESLYEFDIACLVVHAADIPVSDKQTEFKTDARDAANIARCLRSGELQSIYIPSKQLQCDRSLIRVRKQFGSDLVRIKNRIKPLLYFFNIAIPQEYKSRSSRWSRPFQAWLWQLELPKPSATESLKLLMGASTYTLGMKRNIDSRLRQLSQQEQYLAQADLLETVPGIGRHTAIKFLTELGDIQRFSNLNALCNYIGLVPASHNSGDAVKQSRLTRRGHTALRTTMVEAAWVAIGVDPALDKNYSQLKKRMIAQKAIIRIARKLLARIRYVLIHQVDYEKGIVC